MPASILVATFSLQMTLVVPKGFGAAAQGLHMMSSWVCAMGGGRLLGGVLEQLPALYRKDKGPGMDGACWENVFFVCRHSMK